MPTPEEMARRRAAFRTRMKTTHLITLTGMYLADEHRATCSCGWRSELGTQKEATVAIRAHERDNQ